MKSAIELYQEAYSLHFKQGRPDLAREIYQEIIERYPESDERTYAQFLLARITPSLQMAPASTGTAVSVIGILSLLLGFMAVIGVGGILLFLRNQQNTSLYFEKMMLAQTAMQAKNHEGALLFLREAKILKPKHTGAYALASQIHAEKSRFDLAASEYKQLLAADPSNLFAQEQMSQLAKMEKTYQKEQEDKQADAEKARQEEMQNLEKSILPQDDKGKISPNEQNSVESGNINYF